MVHFDDDAASDPALLRCELRAQAACRNRCNCFSLGLLRPSRAALERRQPRPEGHGGRCVPLCSHAAARDTPRSLQGCPGEAHGCGLVVVDVARVDVAASSARTPPVGVTVSHTHGATGASGGPSEAVLHVAILACGWRTNGGEEALPGAGLAIALPFARVAASLLPQVPSRIAAWCYTPHGQRGEPCGGA